MPRGDRTGPMGQGPVTGRGLGYCSGMDRIPVRGCGFGRGYGFGRGKGRGPGPGPGPGQGQGQGRGRV